MDQSRTDPMCGRLYHYSLRVGPGRAVLSLTIDFVCHCLTSSFVEPREIRTMSSASVTRFVRTYICSLVKQQFHFHQLRFQLSTRGKQTSHLSLFGFCRVRNVLSRRRSVFTITLRHAERLGNLACMHSLS
jgi:hypothetical protein